jgi:FkbM family methyltransferase
MKNRIKAFLQAWLGYERYLRLFAWFKVRTLRWDRREKDFFHFLSRVPEDGVVLDVGANLGFLCVHLARRVSRGAVIAFEPLPDNHHVLRRMVRRFALRNVEIYPWAVGDRNGTVSMVLPVQGKARQQGLGHVVEAGRDHEAGIAFEVPVHRLDDVPEVNNPWTRVAAIKIDVENFERFVLRGAMEVLQRDRPLVYLELWDNENRRECFAIAESLGYRVMVFDGHRLVPFEPVNHRAYGNFFFVPSGQPAPARAIEEPAEVQLSGHQH